MCFLIFDKKNNRKSNESKNVFKIHFIYNKKKR